MGRGRKCRSLLTGLIVLIFTAALLMAGCGEKDPGKENLKKAVEVYCLGPDQETVEKMRIIKDEVAGLVPPGTSSGYPSYEEIARERFGPYMTEEGFNKCFSARMAYPGTQGDLDDMGYTTSMKSIEITKSQPSKDRETYAFTAIVICERPDQEPLELELKGRAQSDQEGKLTHFFAYSTLEWLIGVAEGKFP